MIDVAVWNHDLNEQIGNLSLNNSNILDKTLFWFVLFIFPQSHPSQKKSFIFTGVIHLFILC